MDMAQGYLSSHPTRVRGLKPGTVGATTLTIESHPTRVRGLKVSAPWHRLYHCLPANLFTPRAFLCASLCSKSEKVW